jgi:hypothetical protein
MRRASTAFLASLPRDKGSKVTWVEIFTQYVSWCAAQGIAAPTLTRSVRDSRRRAGASEFLRANATAKRGACT